MKNAIVLFFLLFAFSGFAQVWRVQLETVSDTTLWAVTNSSGEYFSREFTELYANQGPAHPALAFANKCIREGVQCSFSVRKNRIYVIATRPRLVLAQMQTRWNNKP